MTGPLVYYIDMMRHTMKDKTGAEFSSDCSVYDHEFKEYGTAQAQADGVYVAFDKFDKVYTPEEAAARLEIQGWN